MFSKTFPFWIVKTRDCLVLKLTREVSISSSAKNAFNHRHSLLPLKCFQTSQSRVESECERKRTQVSIKQTLLKYGRNCIVLHERCMEMTSKRIANKQEKLNKIHNFMYKFHVMMHSLSC